MPSSSPASVTQATASSAAAPDAPAAPAPPDGVARRLARSLPLAIVLLLTAAIALGVRRDGHWWGDDWALYLRQAEALLGGGIDRVAADNRFTVEMSGLPEFTPPMYPWGYPILLAPFVVVLDTDLDRIVISQIVFLCWFAALWYRLARPRIGAPAALLGTVIVGLSPQYLRWVEFVQSEIAYLAVSFTALVLLDRPETRAALVRRGTPWWPLVTVGLVGGFAFSIRKEALAVVAAIAAAQLAAIIAVWWRSEPSLRSVWRTDGAALVGRLAVPHLAFVGLVGLGELALPSTLVPSYTGNGLHNVWGFASGHLGHVAAQVGLRDVWDPTPTVFGNPVLGWIVVTCFVAAFLVGAITMLARRPGADAPLLAFWVVALLIGGSFRYAGSRYVAALGPIALIVAAVGLRTIIVVGLRAVVDPPVPSEDPSPPTTPRRRDRVRSSATAIVIAVLALMATSVVIEAGNQVRDARAFNRSGEVQWGPDHPSSLEMYDAVTARTGPDDVVGAAKARAMTFRTDRRSVQVDRWHPVTRAIEVLTHVVVEPGSPIAAELRDELGATLVWSNARFEVYALPRS